MSSDISLEFSAMYEKVIFIKLCTHHWTPERHVPCEIKTLEIVIFNLILS